MRYLFPLFSVWDEKQDIENLQSIMFETSLITNMYIKHSMYYLILCFAEQAKKSLTVPKSAAMPYIVFNIGKSDIQNKNEVW